VIWELPGQRPVLGAGTFVAPGATVVGDVELGAEASVWFGAVLRGDVEKLTVGARSNVQDNSVLHADPGAPLVLGDDVTVGHMVMLHGCRVGNNSLVGIGAVVMNHARIGANCIVGAKSLVTEGKSYPDGVLIIGAPARVIRELTPAEIEGLKQSAARYVQRAALYREHLRAVTAAGA
jgi:carbonic anhydrase/acetyltransferase-like protein (isoleucine patch superfamily)